LLKAPDLHSGTEHFEDFGCVRDQDVVGSKRCAVPRLVDDCKQSGQTCPKSPKILKANHILPIFGRKTHDAKFQSSKKRPRNFYGANAAWLGVFRTESILITNNKKKKSKI